MNHHHTALASARSFLFVPANRPERFEKALAAGADAVIVDLEDAVPATEKEQARQSLIAQRELLNASTTPVVVRVNASLDELAWLRQCGVQAAAVMWPKASTAAELQAVVAAASPIAVIPLIESVQGYLNLSEIAAVAGVLRLSLGHIDFMADSGISCSDDERELDPLRFALCMHSRAHQLPAPIDGVTVAVKDPARLASDVQRALRFGFGGKLCIHPAQVDGTHTAMRPSEADLDWAKRVIAADRDGQGAAVQVDGQMVDRPVVLRAQSLLQRAG